MPRHDARNAITNRNPVRIPKPFSTKGILANPAMTPTRLRMKRPERARLVIRICTRCLAGGATNTRNAIRVIRRMMSGKTRRMRAYRVTRRLRRNIPILTGKRAQLVTIRILTTRKPRQRLRVFNAMTKRRAKRRFTRAPRVAKIATCLTPSIRVASFPASNATRKKSLRLRAAMDTAIAPDAIRRTRRKKSRPRAPNATQRSIYPRSTGT
jgi:hypothetical protein